MVAARILRRYGCNTLGAPETGDLGEVALLFVNFAPRDAVVRCDAECMAAAGLPRGGRARDLSAARGCELLRVYVSSIRASGDGRVFHATVRVRESTVASSSERRSRAGPVRRSQCKTCEGV